MKSLFSNNFDIKDLREASVILGIKITRFEKGVSLDQSQYVEKILKKYNYFGCKYAYTSYDNVRQNEYVNIIDSQSHATDCTRFTLHMS